MRKIRFILTVVAAWFCVVLSSVYAQDVSSVNADTSFQEQLQRILDRAEVPGVQVMHVKDDRAEIYTAGVARTDTGAPVQTNTIFQAASLSKVVVAYAALRLYDQGVFDLDTPLQDYWTYDRLSEDPRGKKMTARMVLSHTTGLPNWQMKTGRPEWKTSKLDIAFEPGAAFRYSGEGFYFLQLVLEHLTKKPLAEIVEDEVLIPFGMEHSGFIWNDDKMGASYTVGHKGYTPYSHRRFKKANAAYTLLTTATDYTRFVQQGLLLGKGLKPETHAMMLQRASSGKPADKAGAAYDHICYGLGVLLQDNEQGKVYAHTGSNTGYRCFFIAYPDTKESLAIFTNGSKGKEAYQKIAKLFLKKQTLWILKR